MSRQRTWLDDLGMLDEVLVCSNGGIICKGRVYSWGNPRRVFVRTDLHKEGMNFSKKTGKQLRNSRYLEPFDKARYEAWLKEEEASWERWRRLERELDEVKS